MWPFIESIQMIRYLIILRVNRSLVRLSQMPGAEFSRVLGAIIAERLPTTEAAPWKKAIPDWDQELNVPVAPQNAIWPVESVILIYPVKAHYGPDEWISWELKLLGTSADHGFFLEVILPAIEQAAITTDPRWHHPNRLWGRFDIEAVYAAVGTRWEAIVKQGRLDTSRHILPTQWYEGLEWTNQADHAYDQIIWVTPFDLRPAGSKHQPAAPMLVDLLESLVDRMRVFVPGKHITTQHVWNALPEAERTALQQAIEQTRDIPLRRHKLTTPGQRWPELLQGWEQFASIPSTIIPYLELASILHLGRYTHVGLGTFRVSD